MKKNYISISVSSKDLGKRIDLFISEKLDEFSRNKVQMLINNGNLTFNNEKITQTSIKLRKLGTLLLFIPELKPSKIIAQDLQLNIVYEDDYLNLPKTDYVSMNQITLPMHSNISIEQIDYITSNLNEILS